MRWWRSALARLGARTPFGRDVAAAVLLAIVLSVVRIVVTVLVTARQPDPQEVTVPAVLAGTLVTVLDCAVIAFRRRLPRTALAAATALVVVAVGSARSGQDCVEIRRQGRDTLTALRQLVGILREDDAGGRRRRRTLRRLDELVAGGPGGRHAGRAVDAGAAGRCRRRWTWRRTGWCRRR